MIHRRIWELL